MELDVDIYEGERSKAADCHKLGHFTLKGIPPAPAGVANVDIMMALDANGILKVQHHNQPFKTPQPAHHP